MSKYYYCCDKCGPKEVRANQDYFIVEVEHPMSFDKKVKCPFCEGDTWRMVMPPLAAYIRGYGWMDKTGARRDMNRWKLLNEDPYASMRENGEKDDMAEKFRKSGLFNSGRFVKKDVVVDKDGYIIRAAGKYDDEKGEIVFEEDGSE